MRKILLVIDSYQEMVVIESILRRVGFDVMSVAKDVLVKDALLRFHPEIVIATYSGRSVDGVRLAERLRKIQPAPRIALMHTAAQGGALTQSLKGQIRHTVDAIIEAPVMPRKVLMMIAQLATLDGPSIVKKYEKLRVGGDLPSLDEPIHVAVTDHVPHVDWDPHTHAGTATTARTARSDRYDQFLQDHDDPVDQVLAHDKAAQAMKKLRDDSRDEAEELARIDAEKRAFVKAMFKKK